MWDSTPVTTLLSWAWVAQTIEIDNAFEAASADRVGRCVRISLPMWTNGLRHIDEDGVTVDQVRAAARAVCNLAGLERWGWLSVGETGAPRREGYGSHRGITGTTVLRPTRAGHYARLAWPRVVDAIEQRWRTRFGSPIVDALREALQATLLAHPLPSDALPWSPPEINPADGFRTQVIDPDPVRSADSDSDPDSRPLVALLGQALTLGTIDHELASEVSLPLGANLLRPVNSEPARIRDLPALSGISKEAAAMAVTYLQRHQLMRAEPDRAVALSPAGLDALDGYRRQSAAAAESVLREPLQDLLGQTAALSAGLIPPDGGWRSAAPYLAQTRRLLADPTGALPWHPMVLHRAGWPDGS